MIIVPITGVLQIRTIDKSGVSIMANNDGCISGCLILPIMGVIWIAKFLLKLVISIFLIVLMIPISIVRLMYFLVISPFVGDRSMEVQDFQDSIFNIINNLWEDW